MPTVRILAISGSLRAASLNSALLRAVAGLAPSDIYIELFTELGNLPLFNPDIKITDLPPVADFHARLLEADGVIIASPEYAHGVTGVMKNALDWMVGSEAFVNKPVALLNASPRATIAQASLKETLTVMSAQVVEAASITLPIIGSNLDELGIAAHPSISTSIREALRAFHTEIVNLQNSKTHTLYGIKNCDTVKKARNWLDQNGIAYRFHDFRSDGLTPELLQHFADHLDWNKLLNRSSTSWRQLSAEQQNDLTQEKAMQLMLTTPTLIKRPVLESGDKLMLGFKAENYQTELL
ncbi:Spx/MgsR family transcriptional regulator [Methylobacter tundripaludum]|uniref:Spx/MgsR family transcriptional regulator n=1 Tax=Methylobacter tundripaludum TaxID=173365 RepID=A0A2S6HCR6_9GAMM|nr:ArsC family reductase [Methylobacter tundripaludum]PPK75201.1 Spx/MgsR family transcriptional regulator [Methylobacter tundripaludum]